jgi:hypothetical protein
VTGTLYFGINTENNNSLGSATVYGLNGAGEIGTTFGGQSLPASFIDSGSNAYFFDSSIPACTGNSSGFYCPVDANKLPSTVSESAVIVGTNQSSPAVSFSIANADQLFTATSDGTSTVTLSNALTALPQLGGPNSVANAIPNSFDWGLPFFFGRNVYVVFENTTLGSVSGPSVAF